MATVEQLLARLWSTSVGQAVIEEEAASHTADRQSHANALAAIEQHEAIEMPKLIKARAVADAKRKRALEIVQAAQEEFNQAQRYCQKLWTGDFRRRLLGV